jgi:hypothetical protein
MVCLIPEQANPHGALCPEPILNRRDIVFDGATMDLGNEIVIARATNLKSLEWNEPKLKARIPHVAYTGRLFHAIGRNLDLGTLCEDGPDEWSPGCLPWYGSANVFITLVWTWSTEYFLLQTVLIAIGLRFQGAQETTCHVS